MDIAETEREYEEKHVHGVYEKIAAHFSSTRYKVCIKILDAATHDLG